MPMDEDMSVFYDPDIFGTSATYTPSEYSHPCSITITVNGILDAHYVETAQINGIHKVFICKLSDIPDVKNGDWLTCDNVDYFVRDHEPYASGQVRLILGR